MTSRRRRFIDITGDGAIVDRRAPRVTHATTCVLHVANSPFHPSLGASLPLSAVVLLCSPDNHREATPSEGDAHPPEFLHLFLPFRGPQRSPWPGTAWYSAGETAERSGAFSGGGNESGVSLRRLFSSHSGVAATPCRALFGIIVRLKR